MPVNNFEAQGRQQRGEFGSGTSSLSGSSSHPHAASVRGAQKLHAKQAKQRAGAAFKPPKALHVPKVIVAGPQRGVASANPGEGLVHNAYHGQAWSTVGGNGVYHNVGRAVYAGGVRGTVEEAARSTFDRRGGYKQGGSDV